MKTMTTTGVLPKNHLIQVALVTIGLLLIPLVAMQFSSDINWTVSDFVVMGTLLFATGLLLDLAVRRAGKYKVAAAAVIVFLFLWLWAELAVGVFTHWGS